MSLMFAWEMVGSREPGMWTRPVFSLSWVTRSFTRKGHWKPLRANSKSLWMKSLLGPVINALQWLNTLGQAQSLIRKWEILVNVSKAENCASITWWTGTCRSTRASAWIWESLNKIVRSITMTCSVNIRPPSVPILFRTSGIITSKIYHFCPNFQNIQVSFTPFWANLSSDIQY